MRKLIKKWITLLVAICIMCSVFVINTVAAGASSITYEEKLFVAGDEITLTARFCTYSYQPIYKAEGYITYDPGIIEFVSGENCDLITDGKIKITVEGDGKLFLTQQVVFKALTPGLTNISLENIKCFDANNAYQTIDGNETNITVINPNEFASDNANLRSLRVSQGMMVPSFSRDVTSYEVVLPNNAEELLVSVGTEHAKSTYVIEGSKKMELGINKRVIVVTAENGTQKRYTVNITRLDAGENAPEEESLLLDGDRIRVSVDDKTLYVEEEIAPEIIPSGFRQDVHVYNEIEVPCITDDEVVMFYLTNFGYTESAFYVVNEEKEFFKLTTINVGGGDYHILPVKGKEIPNGYKAAEVTIGEQKFSAYKSTEEALSDFILFYAKDPSGNVGFYRYDTLENSVQRADGIGLTFGEISEEETEPKNVFDFLKNLNTNGIVALVSMVIAVLVLIVTISILIVKIATARRKEIMAEDDDYDDNDFFDINFIMTVDKDDE